MSTPPGRARPALLSVRAGLGTAVALALALGTGLGAPVATLALVAGALVFAWGVAALDTDRYRRIAAGNVATVVGGLVALGGLWLAVRADAEVVAVFALAVLAVATESVDGFSSRRVRRYGESAFLTTAVVIVGAVVFLVGSVVAGSGSPVRAVAVGTDVVTANPVAAFWWLQVGVLAVGLVLPRALSVVDTVLPTARDGGGLERLAARYGLELSAVPDWYRVAFVIQFLLAGSSPVVSFVDGLVDSRPVVGAVVDALLLSGVAHWLVGAVLAGLCAVLCANAVARGAKTFAGETPVRTAAASTGAFVAVAVAAGAGALAVLGVVDPLVRPDGEFWARYEFATGAVPLLGAAVCALFLAIVAVTALWILVDIARPAGGGFACGAAVLFCGLVLSADALSALAVVVAAAACLLVWELGVHGLGLTADLAGARPTTRVEVVHGTATVGALAGGAVLAVGVGYLLVPLVPSRPSEGALAALALAVVSLVAFGVALALRE